MTRKTLTEIAETQDTSLIRALISTEPIEDYQLTLCPELLSSFIGPFIGTEGYKRLFQDKAFRHVVSYGGF